MQKLQQQLSDTSGLERGGGLAVALANHWGEWTTFNANLQDGEFGGLKIWHGLVTINTLVKSALLCFRSVSNEELLPATASN